MTRIIGDHRARVETYFTRGSANECWEWTGSTVGAGYGSTWNGTQTVRAHRFVYELEVGPIPDGLILRHRCDNPPCVNPSHLEVGTPGDNVRDAIRRGRRPSTKTRRAGAYGPDASAVAEIMRRLDAGESRHQIAESVGWSRSCVARVVRRELESRA